MGSVQKYDSDDIFRFKASKNFAMTFNTVVIATLVVRKIIKKFY